MTNYPEGIPNWQFLLNDGGIRFKGAFFRWLIVERFGKLILSVTGFSLLILGLVKSRSKKEGLFYYFWLLGLLSYISIFASGNIRHDYYQIPAIPVIAVFMALGSKYLLDLQADNIQKLIARVLVIALITFSLAFGYFEVKGLYWINNSAIVEAGKAVDRLLPATATIIAPYNGDAAFLYQTNRRGYPVTDRPLEDLIETGTKYLVSIDVNDPGIQNLALHCNVIEQTDTYLIVEMFTECIGK